MRPHVTGDLLAIAAATRLRSARTFLQLEPDVLSVDPVHRRTHETKLTNLLHGLDERLAHLDHRPCRTKHLTHDLKRRFRVLIGADAVCAALRSGGMIGSVTSLAEEGTASG